MNRASISRITERDFDVVFELYNKTFLSSPWSKKFFTSYFKNRSRNSLGFCLQIGTKCAGFTWGRMSQKKSSCFNISALWVDQASRGCGYGKKLLQALIDEAKKSASVKKVYVHFRERNALHSFYSKLGFINHKIAGNYSNGEAKHYMDLVLRS